VRQAHRRVFVYLPLVGENEDDDKNDGRKHTGKPQKGRCGDACLRGRHRHLTLPGPGRSVKCGFSLEPDNFVDVVRRAVHCVGQMARTPNARKPKSILAFVAPFTLS
jgi:hypothetical protein